ncbi:hypothetical protein [Paracoccus sp. KR1-242]|uniref:hypothetical protein n=1 Tax=Paracoccus sp. KR1-242 TaxID=3410028 RepID=UPI003C0BDCA6
MQDLIRKAAVVLLFVNIAVFFALTIELMSRSTDLMAKRRIITPHELFGGPRRGLAKWIALNIASIILCVVIIVTL